jgi:uncharacterized membrane protein (UPF0127 family)
MTLGRLFTLLLVALAITAGCRKAPDGGSNPMLDLSEPRAAQPKLATIRLWLGPEQLTTEVAVTAQQIMTGMMFRTNIAENEGMIFVLPVPQRAAFWMKNCFVPLSVAYIDLEGVILEIHDLQPHNTNSVVSAAGNVAYALETAQGWFQRHQVREGMRVRTERGSLTETFRERNR